MIVWDLNKESTKPYCVFGVANTDKGKAIEDEMRQWLLPNYHLIEIWHDGTLFEQPALRYMQDLCIEKKVPCLYVHTKGAYNRDEFSAEVRAMWKHEFTANKDLYFDLVDRPYAAVACPFTGSDKTTWYNGYVANWRAMAAHEPINPNSNRMKFERLFVRHNVQVFGVVRNDMHREDGHTDSKMKEMAEVWR